MSATHYSVRKVWEFEKFLASKPHVWQVEAWNLRCSSEALHNLERETVDCIFNNITRPPMPAFFSARITRMLIGFSLENLIKAVLLQNPKRFAEAFKKEGNLSWGKNGHNLIFLFSSANIQLTAIESIFLDLWQQCALWAGRYPIAMNELAMPRRRVGHPSKAELLKHSQKRIESALRAGDPFMGSELSDLLHSGVSTLEFENFISLYNICDTLLQKIEP